MLSGLSLTSGIGLVALVALVVGGFGYLRKRKHAAWTGFAARHGWSSTGGPFQLGLRGQHQGRTVSVDTEKLDGMEGPARHFTVVRLDVSDVLPRGLTLRHKELGEGILVWLGIRDDEMGHDAVARVLDQHRITPQALAVLRAPPVREHLLALRDHYSHCSLADGLLTLKQEEVPATADGMEVLVGPALDLGEALDAQLTRPAAERARG